jgi:hypothetical protein
MDSTTSIKKNVADDSFISYPNPTSSVFYIKNLQQKKGNIKIFNLETKEVGSLTIDASKGSAIIENLKAEIYFVQINIEGIIYRKKVVVLN